MTLRFDRRQFLMGSTASLLAAGLVRPVFAQDGGLRLLWWGGQSRADRTLAVADAYSAATGTPKAEGEFLSFNDYWPKLATMTAAGNAPDALQMDYRYIVDYATRGGIAPLDEFVASGVLKLDDFDQDQRDGGMVDGKLYGISLGANSVATAVNLTAFEEAGVEPPTMAWTYETMREIGRAFKEANIRDGMKGMSDGSGVEPMLDNWIRQRGKALYSDNKLGPNADDMIEWFTMWNDLRTEGLITSAEDTALDTGAPEVSMIALNKSAMMPTNSNQLVIHQSINPDKLTITSYPRIAEGVGGGHYRKPSQFWSVSGSTPNKEAAAAFISYFVNDIEAGKVLSVERGIPCSKAVRDAITPLLDEQSQIALNFVSSLGDLLGPLPATPPAAAGEIDLSLLRVLSQEVAFGGRTPEDAGKYFVEEATAILERSAAG